MYIRERKLLQKYIAFRNCMYYIKKQVLSIREDTISSYHPMISFFITTSTTTTTTTATTTNQFFYFSKIKKVFLSHIYSKIVKIDCLHLEKRYHN